MRGDGAHADRRQVVHRGTEPDRRRDRRGAGLELVRDGGVGRLLERHRQDHVAASLEGRHPLEQRGLAVKHADSGGPAKLVARERVEVAVEILHVDLHVWYRLRAVDQNRHAARVRKRDHPLDRIDGAQRVRNVRHADEPGVSVEQLLVLVDQQLAGVVDRHHANPGALLFRQHLPRDDVRMVFERGEDDFVTGADEFAAVAVRDQIDRLRGAAGEDHLAVLARADEALHFAARRIEGGSRRLRQVMNAAVDVGVLRRLVAHETVDDRLRHLARGRVVEIHQRLAADFEPEDRKVGADALDGERGRRSGLHCVPDCGHGLLVVCSSRARSSQSLSEATGMRSTISAPNAYVRRLRAAVSESPRLVR